MVEIYPNIVQLLIGFILAAALAILSYRFRWLSSSGAMGTIMVGTIIFGLGRWLYSVPLLFFFISSNILSHLKNEIKVKSQQAIQKAGPRDIWQVFANGGVAAVCLIAQAITGESRLLFLYLASFGVASADTWATEIGTLASARPVSIINFKRVSPGESGGVSFTGTISSLIGSQATVFSAYIFVSNPGHIALWLYASIAGFAGSIIDSILGASVQASYKCRVCGAIVEVEEHCGQQTELVRGFRLINNDVVNFLSNLLAVGIFGYILLFILP